MPNHVYGIIQLTDVGVENFQPPRKQRNEFQKMIPRSVGSMVKGFKIGVTKWVRSNPEFVRAENILPIKVWQRNYYEHIIPNEQAYETISEYIINNPARWNADKFYKQ